MKGIIKHVVFGIFCFIFVFGVVKAETFYEGVYISGEYINKEIDGKTYYMTMQYIEDKEGNIVYCLEPFIKFVDGKEYKEYNGDLTGYNNLTEEQKRKISLIIYYGYGYGNRISSKWYVITQYLVWKTVDPDANIYFTNKLNGNKITKYLNEEKEILNDVIKHDDVPQFIKEYVVDYKEGLIIEGLNKEYEIVSSDYTYSYNSSGNIVVPDIKENGSLSIKKLSNIYKNNVTIYDSSNSQDVIRPGNVINSLWNIEISVRKGDITLDIRNDDSVYTIESDFTDTCYEIGNNKGPISSVCTGSDPLIYKSDYLSYGDYYVKQISVGKGYLVDENIYNISINEDNSNPEIILYNKLLKNDIEILKYACKNEDCVLEDGAVFEIYDSSNKLVDEVVTDTNGYTYITLGYGSYYLKQVKGREGYSLSSDFSEKIVDESTLHYREIINQFIEREGEVLGEYVEIPDTKVDSDFDLIQLLLMIVNIIEEIFAI